MAGPFVGLTGPLPRDPATGALQITPPSPFTLNGKSVQDYTETDIASARPVAAHQGFVAAPGSVPGGAVDYHGVDRVLSLSSALNLPLVNLYPTESNAQHSGSGSIGRLVPGYFFGNNLGTGAAQDITCLQTLAKNNGGGTVTNVYAGLLARQPINTGSVITNLYGLYLEDLAAVDGTVTNAAYAIYSAGGQSYHKGNIGIGSGATSPGATVHLRPTLAADVALKIQQPASPTGDLLQVVDNSNTTRVLTIDKAAQWGIGVATVLAPIHIKGTATSADTIFVEASASGAKTVVMRADGTTGLGLNYPTQSMLPVRLQVELNAAGIQRTMALSNSRTSTNGDGAQLEFHAGGSQWCVIQGVSDTVSGSTNSSLRFQVRNSAFSLVERLRVDGVGVGFFGATPVAKPTLAAAATDLASVITLANDLRTRLINYGLGA